jgi:RHS repeat-associated protein
VARNYYPFGEEITSTSNNDYKFASTFHDSTTGLDYAVNRYYASGMGRFLTVDRKRRSARVRRPGSWNRYVYALNDPINHRDPRGLDADDDDGEGEDWDDEGEDDGPGDDGSEPNGNGPVSGSAPGGWSRRGADDTADKAMRGMLNKTFDSLAADCTAALTGVTGMGMPALRNFGDSLNFYDARPNSQYANWTQNDVTGNGDSTTLAATLDPNDPSAATITRNAQLPAVVLGANFYSNTGLQGATLVHEFLHAAMGVGDNQLFDALAKYGLKRNDQYGTEEISTWFKEGCKKQQ